MILQKVEAISSVVFMTIISGLARFKIAFMRMFSSFGR